MKFCPNCGAKVDADSKFCTNCGMRLEETQETAGANKHSVPKTRNYNAFKNNDFVNKATDWVKKNKIVSIVAVVVALVVLVGGYKYHQTHSSVLYGTEVTLNPDHTGYVSSDALFTVDKKIAVAVAKKDGVSSEIIKSISEADSAEALNDKINDESDDDSDDKLEKFINDLEDLQSTNLTISPDTDLAPGKKVVLKFKDQAIANKLKNEYGINVHPVTVKVKGQQE